MAILPRFADEWVLKRILDVIGQAPIRIVIRGGADVSPSGISPVATVVLEDRNTLTGLLRDPEVSFGDAYMDGKLEVEGFPAELRQVFTNLVANAIEAAGTHGRIRIRIDRAEAGELHGAGAIVEVADSGPGIPPESAKRLFQPFFTTKGADGTGLGLWVSMGIVQKHGGSISLIESSDPVLGGACIRVFLPARTLAQRTGQPAG